ncbi:DUF4188 domain-containing protein [Polymorphobacter megasporae]|uniref:DUF4188 domain-containing protein n=1 Tax=Glacieibacterium megasporae TaxID=2835787 RepID=UPI001C1DED73|nr:DUF4188 domain-containing protein [Polymorphobacter megasporae]UAJ09227.1 DUF4188 domain-containing protein [Polymorphobacter megasporae]
MTIIADRMTAEIEGDFVVFLIGMRINRWWKPWRWLPVGMAMGRMLAELGRTPAMGLLHARSYLGLPDVMVVQYWRSFADLHAYAHASSLEHRPAWTAFNRVVGSNGDVGIWHETFLVTAGQYESLYNNMPPFGLGIAGGLVTARGRRSSAKGRLGVEAADQSSSAL